MHGLRLLFATAVMAGPIVGYPQSNAGVTVIDNPGGGTIAYAQLPAQHTVQGAMGKVLQYVHSRFGARPQVSRVMRGADGNSLAVTFSVKPTTGSTGEIAGLALVIVSASAPAQGAVLTDQADRFRTSVKSMLQQLGSQAGPQKSASDSPSTPSMPAPAPPQAQAPAPAPAPAPTPAAATSAAAAPAGKSEPPPPAAPLHQTPFPDGSGSLGLPDGWTITGTHWGEVIAKGPTPAGLHFNWQFAATERPQGGGGPGAPLVIPYSTDAGATFKAVMTQNLQRQHKTVPSIDILASAPVADHEYFVVANAGAVDGQVPLRTWAHVAISPLNNAGGYQITLYMINVPQQNADQTRGTAIAMFSSYKVNSDVVAAQIHAETQKQQQWFEHQQADYHARQQAQDQQFANYQRQQDVKDRQFAAFDNGLLNNTVVFDKDLNGHGTVSNDLADALVQADPNRFQEVPASDYVKGIDY
jgi:hypothetical protein